jgi:phosphomannomutase/phosphoglucomutase
MKIDPTIYRGYDLRGVMGEQLDDGSYYELGRGYATFLSRRRISECAVGRDNRLNGEKYSENFIKGLNDGGIDTIDIGLSLSQIVYFSSYEFKTKGGAIITASHNPGKFNGLKLSVGYSDTMITSEVQELRKIVEEGKFSEGKGKNRQQDIFPAYEKDLLKHFDFSKKWKVVVDGCNTGSGIFYPKIFRDCGFEVIEQNTKPDGNFPLGSPDPTEQGVLERLAKGVKEAKADIGFAYDADGDRMAVVDENGRVLWMDNIVSLFAKDILEFLPGAKIVYNNLCSMQVTKTIEEAGGKPVMWLTGHSFIKAKVKEERAPFGGELSGHIFFMDNFYGHDDAAFASLRLLAYLDRTNQPLSEAIAKLPQYVSSAEIKLGLSDDIKFDFINNQIRGELKEAWPDAQVIDIDGIRVQEDDFMAVIRASQNGPYVTIKFEGKTQQKYDEVKKTLKAILTKYKEVDFSAGASNIHALD